MGGSCEKWRRVFIEKREGSTQRALRQNGKGGNS